MIQSANGQLVSHSAHRQRKDRFTGERVKALRPEVYRRAVELLAEPREHVPYDHICRLLRVGEHTLKAIEKAESASIAERKQALLAKAMRIAHKAADRIEDQIEGANISQATTAFGVATDKINLLLSGDPIIQIQHSIEHPDGNWMVDRLNEWAARINQQAAMQRLTSQPALPNTGTARDSGAETGLEPGEKDPKKALRGGAFAPPQLTTETISPPKACAPQCDARRSARAEC
jgi:hypothetical protein